MSDLLRFSLPIPPTANRLFTYRAGSRQRIKTDEYRKWATEAAYGLMIQGMSGAVSAVARGRYKVAIWLPFDHKRDIDNAIKPLLDVIVKCGVISDDRWIDELVVRRVPVSEPPEVFVEVQQLAAASTTPRKRAA